jgi:chromosome partitioning protein
MRAFAACSKSGFCCNAAFSMKTVVLGSQKGGSAKTTLTAHLAVEAERRRAGPAWIIDTDQQATLSTWHSRRQAETPQRAEIPLARLAPGLHKLAAGHAAAFCFVDTAPAASTANVAIFAVADLVLIPVRPSPADLWAVGATVAAVREAGRPFLFAITQAKPGALVTAQTIAALSKHGPVAQAIIADRVGYATSMTSGHTAPEVAPKGPAAAEVAALWEEVASFVENSNAA